MRASELRFVTLREWPADAVAAHERLLRRAGFVRKAEGGVYVFLPLGARVLRQMVRLFEADFEKAGIHPVVPPQGDSTREVLETARSQVRSWRSLPVRWYWLGTARDDECEPRGGLIHTREWQYVRVCAIERDRPSAEASAEALAHLLCRLLKRIGLTVVAGEGDGWQVLAPLAEANERLLLCASCRKGFVPEWCPLPASGGEPPKVDGLPPAEVVSTPNLRTVEEVARFLGVPESRLVKTLLVEADGHAVAVLVRGDHALSLPKLQRVLGASEVQMLSGERVEEVSGAPVGFAGPVGLHGVPLLADWAVREMQGFVVGANLEDAHRVNVCWGRDFAQPQWADLRVAVAGDLCALCGGALEERSGAVVAHVGYLSGGCNLLYDDAQGQQQEAHVLLSELNLTRTMALMVETGHDEDGIIWHPRAAPFEVVVLLLNPSEEQHLRVAERLTEQLQEAGLEVLLDDRDERAGAKFKDADLMGVPVQVVIGRSVAEGAVELRLRRERNSHRVAIEDAVIAVEQLLRRETGEDA